MKIYNKPVQRDQLRIEIGTIPGKTEETQLDLIELTLEEYFESNPTDQKTLTTTV